MQKKPHPNTLSSAWVGYEQWQKCFKHNNYFVFIWETLSRCDELPYSDKNPSLEIDEILFGEKTLFGAIFGNHLWYLTKETNFNIWPRIQNSYKFSTENK